MSKDSAVDNPVLGEYWTQLQHDNRVKSKTQREKILMVVSLILFLQLPFAPLLLFLFRSEHPEVKQKAGNFL